MRRRKKERGSVPNTFEELLKERIDEELGHSVYDRSCLEEVQLNDTGSRSAILTILSGILTMMILCLLMRQI